MHEVLIASWALELLLQPCLCASLATAVVAFALQSDRYDANAVLRRAEGTFEVSQIRIVRGDHSGHVAIAAGFSSEDATGPTLHALVFTLLALLARGDLLRLIFTAIVA